MHMRILVPLFLSNILAQPAEGQSWRSGPYEVYAGGRNEARRERDNIDHGMVTMVLPAGIGAKLGISNHMDIGFEIGGRYSLNDYLDGFTSPTATSNDIYYLTTVQLVYRLTGLRAE